MDEGKPPPSPSVPSAARRLAREGVGEASHVIDDDELQAALARQRRTESRKRVKAIRGEDLARQSGWKFLLSSLSEGHP